jgi:hypothetical protein
VGLGVEESIEAVARKNALAVTLRAVVRFAQHLAVVGRSGAARAPGGHVIGIHVVEFPKFGFAGVVTEGTQRAV